MEGVENNAGVLSAVHVNTYVITKTLTSAEMLALNTTPIEVIPDPGDDKGIVIDDVIMELLYNSAAYAGIAAGENIEFRYNNSTGRTLTAFIETSAFLVATSYQKIYQSRGDHLVRIQSSRRVVVRMASGNITSGNSPVRITLHYRIVDA